MEHLVDGLVPQASEEVLAVVEVLFTCLSFSTTEGLEVAMSLPTGRLKALR